MTDLRDVTLVVMYLRLSDARHENGSFEDRKAKLMKHAKRRGWTVARVIIENDEMPGGARKSASAFKRRRIVLPDGRIVVRVYRPGFRSILDDLTQGRAHVVLAEDLDRAMRDPRDLEDLIDVCQEYRSTADSLSGSLRLTEGGTDAEITNARIMVAIANKASRDTARRVADARERQARKGAWGGGKRPFGFLADGVTVDPAEAAEIVKAAEAVMAGVSLRQLAFDLREREVPTVKGTRWTAETLKDILVRPRNAGISVYRPETKRRRGGAARPPSRYYTEADEIGRAPWEPILPEDTWRAVVAKLTDPARATSAPGPAHRWLGSGIYRCVCGTLMQVLTKGDKISPAYRCRDTGLGNGVQHTVRNVRNVDALVVDTLVEFLSKPDAADLLAAPSTGVDLNALRADVKTWRQSLLDYVDGEIDGRYTKAQVQRATVRLNAKISEAEQTLNRHTGRSPLAPLIGVVNVRAAWDALSLGAQREIVRNLFVVTILEAKAKGRSPFLPETVRIERARTD